MLGAKLYVVFFAVLGPCSGLDLTPLGLDDALEYSYSFESRVGVDLGGVGTRPGARAGDHMAGAAISGRLTVQKTGYHNLGFKLSNLQVGDHLGRVECDGAAQLPVVYRPMPEEFATQLEKPFFFHMEPSDPVFKSRLEVPKNDLLWMVNVRKSLLNNLQDYMVSFLARVNQHTNLTTHFKQESSDHVGPITQHVLEDTLFGTCHVRYIVEPASESFLDSIRKTPLSHDMQSPRFHGRKLANGRRISAFDMDSLIKVTRTIDHARCSEQPLLIRSAVANFSDFRRHAHRHSTYTYHIRGSLSSLYRLEHVSAEGYLSYNPFGFKSERLQTLTNQTIVLESVSEKQRMLQPDDVMKVLGTLRQGAESPYAAPQDGAEDWIVYTGSNSDPDSPQPVYWEKALLGVTVSDELHHQYKEDLHELLRSSVQSLQSNTVLHWDEGSGTLGASSAGQAAAKLHSAARLAAALPTSVLQQLWDDLPPVYRPTYLQVLSASGGGPAAALALRLITPQGRGATGPVPTPHHVPLLLAMAANTPDPGLAVPLVQYLQAMNLKEEPVVGPLVYVSGANILRQMCTNSSAVPGLLYGSHQCPRQYVVDNFAQFLRQKIETSAASSWQERAALLQTYATLGLDIDLAFLTSLSRSDQNLIVRTTAVYATSPRYLDASYRHQAMEAAYTNVVDPTLDREVRQSSLVVLLSWGPDQPYWDQLALYTWSNHSSAIVRFLYSSMLAVADNPDIDSEQSHFAASALLLARPVRTPAEASLDLAWSAADVPTEAQLAGRHAWYKFPPATHSSQLYHALDVSAGQLHFNVFEVMADFNHYPGVMSPVESSRRSDESREAPQMKFLLKLLTLETFLPIDFAQFGIGHHSTCPLCELLWYGVGPCGVGSQEVLLFGELAAVEVFIPNEMGLPVLAEIMNPTAAYWNTSADGSPCREPFTGHFDLAVDAKLVSKMNSVLRVMVPWLNSSIAVGIDTEKTLSLPVAMNGQFQKTYKTSVHSESGGSRAQFAEETERQNEAEVPIAPGVQIALTLAVQSARHDEVPVAVAQAVPFTCVKPLRPGNDPSSIERLLVLRDSNGPPVEQTIPLGSEQTGIDASLRYEGDLLSPYTLSNVIEHIRTPAKFVTLLGARSGKFERSVLSVGPRKASNDSTVIKIFVDSRAGQSSSGSSGAESAACQPNGEGELECPPGPSSTVGMEVTFPSGGAVAGNVTCYGRVVGDPHYESSVASLSLSASDGASQHQMHVVANTSRPVPLSLAELSDWLLLERNLNASVNLSVWAEAPSSNTPPVLTLKAVAGVSGERLGLLREKVKTACSADALEPPLALDGLAVYDLLNVTAAHTSALHPSLVTPWRVLQDYFFASLYPSVLPVYGQCNCGSDTYVTVLANRSLLTNTWSASCPACCRPWTASDLKSPRCLDTSLLALARFTSFSSDPANEYHIPQSTCASGDASECYAVDTRDVPQPVNYEDSLREGDSDLSSMYRDDAYTSDYIDDDDDASSAYGVEQGTCWTSNNKLKTADGLFFRKIPSSCYQLAVAHCHFEPKWYVFTHVDVHAGADVRSPFFRYLDSNFDVDVYLGYNTLIVNGIRQDVQAARIPISHPITHEEIGWCSGDAAGQRVSCTVTGVVHMEAGHLGGIVKLLGTDVVCGMCGNNNRVQRDDNIGAHLCSYSDLSLMAASWTKDYECPWAPELDDQLEKVHAFQNSNWCIRPSLPRPSRLPDLYSLPPLPRLPSFPGGPEMRLEETSFAPIAGQPTVFRSRAAEPIFVSEPGLQNPGADPKSVLDFISESELIPEELTHPQVFTEADQVPDFTSEFEPQLEMVARPEIIEGIRTEEPRTISFDQIEEAPADHVELVPNGYPLSQSNTNDSCYVYGYKVELHVRGKKTVTASLNATNLCDRVQGCQMLAKGDFHVHVAEWKLWRTPPEVKNAIPRGYLLKQPSTKGAKIKQMDSYTAMLCAKE